MSYRELFQGYAISGIDAKGRVAIPAALRGTIDANGDGRIVTIALHEASPCLIGYDQGWAQFLREELRSDEASQRAAGGSFDRHNAKRRAFGPVEKVPYDTSGRFVFPGFLSHKAKLTDTAFFYGTGDTFEIWSPQVLLATPDVDGEMKEICEWLLIQRGAK